MTAATGHGAGRWLFGLLLLLFGATAAPAQFTGGPQQPTDKVVADVVPRGNRYVPSEQIRNNVKTRAGQPYNPATVQEDVNRLLALRSFSNVLVRFDMTPADQVIVYFDVTEYPTTIREIVYDGAKHLKDDELNTITGLRRGVPLNPIANNLAKQAILRRYQDMGRLYASVDLAEGNNPGDSRVVFRITEGPEVHVTSVDFVGHSFVSGERLRQQINVSRSPLGLGLLGGTYNPAMIEIDRSKLEEYYRTYGFQDVRVSYETIFSADNRNVSIVFHINEGTRYRVKQVQITGNQTISEERIFSVTKLAAGNLYDQTVVQADLKYIQALYGYASRQVAPREQVFAAGPGEVTVVYEIQERPPATVGQIHIVGNDVTKERVIRRQIPLYPGQPLTYPDLKLAEANLARLNIFEANAETGVRPTVSILDPDSDNPVKDILVQVQEAPTGSLLLGVGVNSDAGLTGSIVLNERNFDLFRPPTSFDELLAGRAWRGAGQEFRLEAVPGTQIQRYTASFREPSLFDSAYSFGMSGYYFQRSYNEYLENRTGARFTIGRKLGPLWSATASLRVEEVNVNNVPYFAPPDIANFAGNSFLVGGKFGLTRDARDSYLRPTEGSMLDLSYEQVSGDYTFPIFSGEFSKFWTLWQRPDGSGRQVLAYHTQAAFTTHEAPVFERFYAGGFRSMRGFEFRGVGPFTFGLNEGGEFMWLNSVEYQIPLVASDKLYAVGFIDSGTVERTIEIKDYRVTAGLGLRIVVPMLGPVPIALDFGVPIVKGPDDRKQLFSFWLGFFN
jgi:outer membrane protein insertion porin family